MEINNGYGSDYKQGSLQGHKVTDMNWQVYSIGRLACFLYWCVCKETQHVSVSVVNVTYINGDLVTKTVSDNVQVSCAYEITYSVAAWWLLVPAGCCCSLHCSVEVCESCWGGDHMVHQ